MSTNNTDSERAPLRSLRVVWTDLAGVRRCRALPWRAALAAPSIFAAAAPAAPLPRVGLTRGCMGAPVHLDTVYPDSGLTPVGETLLTPDPEALVPRLPWWPAHGMANACHLERSGAFGARGPIPPGPGVLFANSAAAGARAASSGRVRLARSARRLVPRRNGGRGSPRRRCAALGRRWPGPRTGRLPDSAPSRARLRVAAGEPWACCPRSALKRCLARLEERHGLKLLAGFELEFVILKEVRRSFGFSNQTRSRRRWSDV